MSEFTVNEIQNITFALRESNDHITSFTYSEDCILIGSAKGSIHIIDLANNEGMMFGPYNYPIKDLSSLKDTFAYTTSSKVVLLNKRSRKEVFSYSASYEKVCIWSNSLGNSALVCASTSQLFILQKGWVNVGVKALRPSYNYIQNIKNNSHILCLVDCEKAEILNLLNEEILFSSKVEEGIGHFHWFSNDSLLFSTGYFIDVLKFRQEVKESISLSERISITCIANSICSIKQYIVFNTDKIFMLGNKREILVSQNLPSYGRLVTNGTNDSKIILFTANQVFILSLPNIKEKIMGLIKEYKLDQARELIEKYHITALNDLQPFIDDLIRRGRFEDAATFVNNAGLESESEYSRDIIQVFATNYKLHLISSNLPYIENTFMNSMIIHSLASHQDLLLAYIKKCPLTFPLEKTVLNQLKSLTYSETLFDIFIQRNLIIDACEFCINSLSEKTFELLEKFPDRFMEFSQISGFYSKLFEINVEKAFMLCKKQHQSSFDVLAWLSPTRVIQVLAQQPDLDPKQEEILLDEILATCPEDLKRFIGKFKTLSIDNILQKIQNTKLDDLKVFLHQKQENKSEVLKILKVNFEVRVNYLKSYPELWTETLIEAKSSSEMIRKVLKKIHYFENALDFIQTLDFHEYEKEIRRFIIKFGSLVKLHKLSVSSARLEEFLIFKELFEEYAKGISFELGKKCCICTKRVFELNVLRLRKCGHHSHRDCMDNCTICVDVSILSN